MSRPGAFSTSALRFAGGQAVAFAIGILYGVLSARALGVSAKGELAIFVATVNVLAIALEPGFRSALPFFAARGASLFVLRNAGLVLSAAVGVLVAVSVAFRLLSDPWVAIGVTLLVARDALTSLFYGVEKIGRAAALGVVFSASSLLSFAILVVGFDLGLTGAKAAFLLALAAGVAFALVLLGQNRSATCWPSRSLVGSLVGYGLRAYLAQALGILASRLDLLLVAAWLGPEAAGLFSVALFASELASHVPSALSAVLFPRASASKPEEAAAYAVKCLRHATPLLLAASACAWLVGRPLLGALYGGPFRAAAPVLSVLSLGWGFSGMRLILMSYFAGTDRPHRNSTAVAVHLVLTLMLNLVLIPAFGLLGAALAHAAAHVLVAVVLLHSFRVERRRPLWSDLLIGRAEAGDYGRLLRGLFRCA